MTRATANDLLRIFERAGLRDPSLSDEDRDELFRLALKSTHGDSLEWLAARLAEERRDRA